MVIMRIGWRSVGILGKERKAVWYQQFYIKWKVTSTCMWMAVIMLFKRLNLNFQILARQFEHVVPYLMALFYFAFVFLLSRVNEYIGVRFVCNSRDRRDSIVDTLFYGDGILLVFLMNFVLVGCYTQWYCA